MQFWFSLVLLILGTALIVAQIVIALKIAFTKAEKKPGEGPTITNAGLDPEKTFELLKSLAANAPLMVGGLVLFGLYAFITGDLSFTASTTVE
jgi:hypothetical protein